VREACTVELHANAVIERRARERQCPRLGCIKNEAAECRHRVRARAIGSDELQVDGRVKNASEWVVVGDGHAVPAGGIRAHRLSHKTERVGACKRGASAVDDDLGADGIAVRRPVPEALSDMVGLVDDVLLVSDGAIKDAMRAIFQKAGLVVEPAGAAGVAAAMEHASLRSSSLATVLCGSNLTQEQMRDWLFH